MQPCSPAQDMPPRSRCLADVAPQAVSFLWRPRLPAGKLTLLDGDPGQGKSYIAAAIAAAASLGRGLPESGDFQPVTSLLFTAEDGLADTLRPRMEAMGADLSRVFAYEHAIDLSKPEGLATVAQEIERLWPALVVIDPIVAYLGGRTDMHRANEVRAILAPLASFAADQCCAMLAVRHLSKARSGRALHAGLGSVDFTAAARSVLLAGSSPTDPDEHALVHIKSNLAKAAPALGYRLGENGSFEWTGRSSLTAGDLLAPEPSGEQRTAQTVATAWLSDLLRAGPLPALEVKRKANAAGIAWRTVERAAAEMAVQKKRSGFGSEGGWQWSLVRDAA
jgi:putative DNA primase/helicase